MGQNVYLLLDSRDAPLAKAALEGSTNTPNWQLRVLDDKIETVLQHKSFKLMSITDSGPSYVGKVIRSRNDLLQLEVTKAATDRKDKRQNLRIAADFKSCMYPLSGRWKGRQEIEANDISCGGIAFYSRCALEIHERVEIVVTITSQPLIVCGEILRMRVTDRTDSVLYAAKFVNLCNDEEMLLREAVFNQQLSGRPR